MQALADPFNQENRLPTMTLSTGVYTIENVKNHNWAVLLNENDRSDVIAGNSADKDAGEKVTSNFYERELKLNHVWCSGISNSSVTETSFCEINVIIIMLATTPPTQPMTRRTC